LINNETILYEKGNALMSKGAHSSALGWGTAL